MYGDSMADIHARITDEPPQPRAWHRRWKIVAIAFAAGAVLAVAAGWALPKFLNSPRLQGAVLTPPLDAHNFRLTDQHGRLVSLTRFRGKVVALTFLYTHCPHVCPLIASTMHKAYQRLGDTAQRAAFVAISVDPRGDTPEAVQTLLSTHHMDDELTYLTGSFAELKVVWGAYYIGSEAKDVRPKTAVTGRAPDVVGHSALVYLIDRRGEIRAILPSNFDPQDLVTDVRILSSER